MYFLFEAVEGFGTFYAIIFHVAKVHRFCSKSFPTRFTLVVLFTLEWNFVFINISHQTLERRFFVILVLLLFNFLFFLFYSCPFKLLVT